MTNPYNRAGLISRLRQLALATVLCGGATAAQAQFYTAANVANTAGTYTDLGTTGTVITTANFDDANSAVQTIPFTFTYGNTAFTEFTLNTNGFLKLGATAPVAPFFPAFAQEPYSGPMFTQTNVLLPFNADLEQGSSPAEYRMAVSGAAGSRVLTIQWKNVSDKARPAASTNPLVIDKQYANFSFQVKLHEGSNRIDYVYGTATPSTFTSNANFIVVGLKGANNTAGQVIAAVKPSNNAYSTTTFQQGGLVTPSNGVNIRSAPTAAGGVVVPDPGRTFSFIRPTPNDAAVQIVYGFNKLVVPAGSPVQIRALVRNAGTAALNNVTVTLNVTGANTASATQTVNSLAVGATAVVSFSGVAVPNVGNNTLTVTVGPDSNPANDAASMLMVTDPTTTSFITPNSPAVSGFGTASGFEVYFAAKITLTAPRDIVAVRAYIGDAAPTATQKTTVGETLYGVVVDATTGAILGRSAPFVVTAAAVETIHTFTMTAPVAVPAGDVLVGMVQVAPASNGPLRFFPMGVQAENPTRPDTFFSGPVSATPTAPAPSLVAPNNQFKFMLEAVTAAPATCTAPTAVVATGTSSTASVSFTGPANSTGYQVVYGPAGFNPTTGGTTSATFTSSPFSVSGLSPLTCYDFYVRAICTAPDQSALVGPVSFCTPCTPPIITSFPYTQNFDVLTTGQSVPCGISVTDVNADNNTWRARATVPVDGMPPILNIGRGGSGNAMVYFFNTQDPTAPANDWFYTPALRLVGGQAYRLSFFLRAAGGMFVERLEVKYGTSATPAGQTTSLYTNTNVNNPAYAAATGVADITPTATGTYFIGFHATSPADQFFLAVDDVAITAVLGTSDALKRAVSVYPNPSATGKFNLEVRGANAKSLGVEVTNMLGQRVYTGSAKDNFTNEVNLSNLAAGIYTLKVKNGNEYSLQQISIVK